MLISWYRSSFHPARRYARLHLPSSGSLGSRFPTFPAFLLLGHRYYDPLRLPLLRLGSLRISLDPRYLALTLLSSCPFTARFPGRVHPVHAWPLLYTGLPVPVSRARRWRSSRVPRLPLCVHAPLEDPGGVLSTRHDVSRTAAFRLLQTVGFTGLAPGYPFGPPERNFRGSVTRPTHSLRLASNTPLRGMHAGSLQIRRLTYSGGIWAVSCPHPLGNTIQFHNLLSDPKDLGLTRHEKKFSWRQRANM